MWTRNDVPQVLGSPKKEGLSHFTEEKLRPHLVAPIAYSDKRQRAPGDLFALTLPLQ